jgi:glycosyltransferase involved in cell wall biosynthesis
MNAPVTLLYVITGTNTGGAEKALGELLARIDRSRFRVLVCSLKRPGAYAARLAAHADGFYHLGLGEAGGLRAGMNFFPALLRLARIMRRERPRIVHCFLFRASMAGRLAALLCPGAAVIAGVRVQEQSALKYLCERITRPLVDCYAAVSDEVRRTMIERAHIDPDRIVTIYNGIECAFGHLPSDAPGRARSPVRLALIGRLHCQKGHGVLLEAFRSILDTGRQAHLFFAGEGPDEDLLRGKTRDLGVAEAVTFAGVVDDPLAFIAGIDIVVLPSLWEGMPNVLLEAMAASRPIVASRLGGIEEMLRDGQSALLCEPGRAGALADAIMRLMDEPDLGRSLAAAARRDVEQRFDIARTVAATQALYERLMLRCAGRRG